MELLVEVMKINSGLNKLFFSFLILGSLYSGCLYGADIPASHPQSETIKIPLKLFTIPDPKDMSPFALADFAVFRAFTKKYPDIEPQVFSGIAIERISKDFSLFLAITNGNIPDMKALQRNDLDDGRVIGHLNAEDAVKENVLTEAEIRDGSFTAEELAAEKMTEIKEKFK